MMSVIDPAVVVSLAKSQSDETSSLMHEVLSQTDAEGNPVLMFYGYKKR